MADVRNWDPPSEGSTAREEDMPSHAFLDAPKKRYPYKYENAKGEWVESYKGLMAARNRAAQQNDQAIFQKATRKINKLRAARKEEPLSMAMHMDETADFNREIILACDSGIKELKAIRDYTRRLMETQNGYMRDIYTDNRLDELPHIQNIVVALTAMVSGEEPKVAARMDGREDEAGDGSDKQGDDGSAGGDAWQVRRD